MSSSSSASHRNIDRRVLRTRERLGDALVGLMLERPFESIRVQDVLDRAGVGRSTFYAHFRDKNDLFLSDNEDFWGATASMLSRRRDPSDRVAPVREMFVHLAEMRRYYDALVASDKLRDTLELAQGHFARGIERRLAELPRGRSIPAESRRALAQALAGAFLSLMTWWIDRGAAETPAEMDDLFHRLVWAGVAADERRPSGVRPDRTALVRS